MALGYLLPSPTLTRFFLIKWSGHHSFQKVIFIVFMFRITWYTLTRLCDYDVRLYRQKSNLTSNSNYFYSGTIKVTYCHSINFKSWIENFWFHYLKIVTALVSGVIANVVFMKELLYVFYIINSLQGVHIFLAFGLSKKVNKIIYVGCSGVLILK